MNESKQNLAVCERCGAALAPGALGGLCPRCLMALNLAPQTDLTGAEAGPNGTQVVKPPPPTPPSCEEIARHFPQLEVLACLGRGGMGAVYKARQPKLDRFVALKILLRPREDAARDAEFGERFEREARALARLNHPAIVAVYDFGEAGGYPYLLMEYVDGLTLRQLEQSGRLAPDEALGIVPKICEALQFAHRQGIVHRDIKPENILLDKQGGVKIADFGIAKMVGLETAASSLTQDRQVIGTPHYMAPEQIEKPHTVDHRADIYSLGVVFYEMLTGELPLGKFAPPSRKVQMDVRLDEVVLRALEKEPELRYQQASQVKTAVETIVSTPASVPPVASAGPALEAGRTDPIRRQIRAPAIGLVVTGIVNWVLIPLAAWLLVPALSHAAKATGASQLWVLLLALLPLVLCSFIIVAGLKMMRFEAYWAAVVASVLAIVITPGNIVGLPLGLWALTTLSRRDVREAFGARRPGRAGRGGRGGSLFSIPVVVACEGRPVTYWPGVIVGGVLFAVLYAGAMTVALGLAMPDYPLNRLLTLLGLTSVIIVPLSLWVWVRDGHRTPLEALPQMVAADRGRFSRVGKWPWMLAAGTAAAVLGFTAIKGQFREPKLVLLGIVRDAATGQPVAGAQVASTRPDKPAASFGAATTDADGRYVLTTLWKHYKERNRDGAEQQVEPLLLAWAPGYQTNALSVSESALIGGSKRRLDFQLQGTSAPLAAAAGGAPGQPAAVNRAVLELRLEQAERAMERMTRLREDNVVSEEQVEAAKDQVAIAKAELGGNPAEVARVKLAEAERNLARMTRLHTDNIISTDQLEKAKDQVALAKAELAGDSMATARVRLAAAERELVRKLQLVQSGVLPVAEAEAAKDAVAVAKAELAGDSLEIARVRLAAAERQAQRVAESARVGRTSAEEREVAEGELGLHKAELQVLLPGSAAGKYGAKFGPIIERWLFDPDDDPHTNFIVFESGKVIDMPVPWQAGGDLAEALNALGHAVDALSDASGNSLMLFNGHVVRVNNERFDRATANALLANTALDAGAPGSRTLSVTNPPATYLFKTVLGNREHRGVLQITGFTEAPRAVKLRYKLVQSADVAPASRPR